MSKILNFPSRSSIDREIIVHPVEIGLVVSLIFLFIGINLVTAAWFPSVWVDEVMFADPAANLYLGNGFVSSAWFNQGSHEFWAGNAPLYTVVLYQWIQKLGFNLVSVRSLNYVVIALSGLTLWLATIRLQLIRSIWIRIMLLLVLFAGTGVSFSYRSGRYDCLAILLVCLLLLAFSLPKVEVRCLALGVLGCLLPLTGLQLMSFIVISSCLIFLFLRQSILKELISLGLGLAIGFGGLYFFFSSQGVWQDFMATLKANSIDTKLNAQHLNSFTEKLIFKISNYPIVIAQSLAKLPQQVAEDRSFLVLLITALATAIYQIKTAQFKRSSLLSFGIVISIVIPTFLALSGRGFPLYYSWMVYVPLTVCLCCGLDRMLHEQPATPARFLALGLISTAIFVGLPSTLVGAWPKSDQDNYTTVTNFVRETVKSGDVVYSDFCAFYPLKQANTPVFFPTYFPQLSETEKQQISVLMINTDPDARSSYNVGLDKLETTLGGKWVETGRTLEQSSCSLKVYRKSKPA
jgi:hypothetical protein